jgi:alkanesulfonate monooxygenase SsuD/methylene tetrahydromethanopterin reductase-like flavin-dependent oxidoreductase (luciferase family)
MREYVEVVRRIHRREVMDYVGERLRSTHYRLGFEPHREHVPIWIAVLKPGMMRLSGEIADGMLMYFSPLSYVEIGVDSVGEGLASAGRKRSDFDLALMIPVCVTDEPEAARAIARKQVAWYNNLPFYNDMFALAGFENEAGQLRDAWAEIRERDPEGNASTQLDTGGTEQYVTDEMADAVVVIGDAEHAASRIEEYVAAGVDTPIVFPFGGYEPGESWEGFTHTLAEVRKAYR